MLKLTFITNINQIAKTQWQSLVSSSNPFIQYDYFYALESSSSATAHRGWQAHHLLIHDVHDDVQELVAIMPLYIKAHSWGEYVFDRAWADAYEHYQLDYYPKLVASIPFTPITSDKLLSHTLTLNDVLPLLIGHLTQSHLSEDKSTRYNFSGIHALFVEPINTVIQPEIDQHIEQTSEQNPEKNTKNTIVQNDLYHRHTVQFHWFNQGYKSFDDYLSTFMARKRKNTKKERASIIQQGLSVQRIMGEDLTKQELDYFYFAYQSTYAKKGHEPHLSYHFFQQIFKTLANNIMLVVARKTVSEKNDDEFDSTRIMNEKYDNMVACALFFYDDTTLYGRYWGCSEQFNNLHFELCYYQGIEFCIENDIQTFNPGTQGEHKIQRGFTPILTHSYHWLTRPEFKPAIAEYCEQERRQIRHYQKQCAEVLPFKKNPE